MLAMRKITRHMRAFGHTLNRWMVSSKTHNKRASSRTLETASRPRESASKFLRELNAMLSGGGRR